MDQAITFSVIIPVYNAEKYLRPALDSVLVQTCANWECVCVDDGSTDASASILDEYANRDKRFTVIHQANQGVAVARNVGLGAAKGQWITWLDADDMYAPNRLLLVLSIVQKEHPDLVHLHFLQSKDEDNPFREYKPDYQYKVYDTPASVFRMGWEQMNFRGMVWLWFARREVLNGLRFYPGMRIKEDGVFTLSLIPRLKKVCKGMDRGLFYRQRETSAMHTSRRASDCICYQKAMLELWRQQREFAQSIGQVELLRWRIQRGVGTDVIDWILGHPQEEDRPETVRSVHKAYCNVKASGAFSAFYVQDSRYRVAFPLYERFGWCLPVRVVAIVCAFGGNIMRRLLRKKG